MAKEEKSAEEQVRAAQQKMAADLWEALGLEPRSFEVHIEAEGFADTWSAMLGKVRSVHKGTRHG